MNLFILLVYACWGFGGGGAALSWTQARGASMKKGSEPLIQTTPVLTNSKGKLNVKT